MNIKFTKIEGLGNDYIYIEKKSILGGTSLPKLARLISDRRFGAGSDGLITIKKLSSNSAQLEIYNSDGSKALFCGNGLRGAALYLKLIHKLKSSDFTIKVGEKDYQASILNIAADKAVIKAELGPPSFQPSKIGLKKKIKSSFGIPLKINSRRYDLYCLAIPNPHAIVYVKNYNFDWCRDGYAIEHNPIFRNKANVMFAKIKSPRQIAVIPWERGSGATLACGSGAAAATVMSSLLGLTARNVVVLMPGGSLKNYWDISQNVVFQEGPSRLVYSGVYKI